MNPRSEPGTGERGALRADPVRVEPLVEVRRSPRRVRTVSAYREGDRVVVLIPGRFSAAQETEWVGKMVSRLARKTRRPHDRDLARRADDLSARYLRSLARPTSVAWTDRQNTRWGSCTPADGSIRLSHRLQTMPTWVQDYVLLHELAHLIEPSHGPAFWALLGAYPRTERARGYLEGFQAGRDGPRPAGELPPGADDDADPDAAPDEPPCTPQTLA